MAPCPLNAFRGGVIDDLKWHMERLVHSEWAVHFSFALGVSQFAQSYLLLPSFVSSESTKVDEWKELRSAYPLPKVCRRTARTTSFVGQRDIFTSQQ